MSETPPIKSRVIELIVVSGWLLLIAVCFCTIIEVCYLSVYDLPISDSLQKLAFTAAGFLFGNYPVLLKDLLNNK